MRNIVINKNENNVIDIALLEDGKLVELYEECNDANRTSDGNIYCGIVRNILPGMQSAFVDINERKNAFMHIKDVLPKVNNCTGNKEEKFEKYDIGEFVTVNKPILVQVKKNEENKKGAKVSKNISLTGKFVVLMPDVDFVTVSQKIDDKKQKERLKNVAKEVLTDINKENEKYGLILRTATINASKKDIEDDVKTLIKKWKKTVNQFEKRKIENKPIKLYESNDYIEKIIIGTSINTDCEITINDEELYNKVLNIKADLKNEKFKVTLKEDSLLNMFDLEKQIEKSKERKIWLNCGGFITIDKTEALTAIDVNSGKFIGKKSNSKSDTIFKVNEDATIEIAKQLRLRNISGIIVVDYIDMEQDKYREEIVQLLNKEIKKDRSKIQIVGFTKLDLLEITRKKL